MSYQADVAGRHWTGPLDLLVEMARRRKVDLAVVSMVELVDASLLSLKGLTRLEEKADQLLLLSDLIAMKSRLLIGTEEARADEEEALRLQALRLERIQRVASMMMNLDQLGQDVWPRGAPELENEGRGVDVVTEEISILDLVRVYARLRLRDESTAPIEIRRILAMTLTQALGTLGDRLGELDHWTELFSWAGRSRRPSGISARSQAAASFVASRL